MNNQWPSNTLDVKLFCHRCAYTKSKAELVNYGRFRLCRDCAQKYENLKEKEQIGNVETFVTAE